MFMPKICPNLTAMFAFCFSMLAVASAIETATALGTPVEDETPSPVKYLVQLLENYAEIPRDEYSSTREQNLDTLIENLRALCKEPIDEATLASAKLCLGVSLLHSDKTSNSTEGSLILRDMAEENASQWQGKIALGYTSIKDAGHGQLNSGHALEQLEREVLPAARKLDRMADPLSVAVCKLILDSKRSKLEYLFTEAAGALAERSREYSVAETYYKKILDSATDDRDRRAAESDLNTIARKIRLSKKSTADLQDNHLARAPSSTYKHFRLTIAGGGVFLILLSIGFLCLRRRKNRSKR